MAHNYALLENCSISNDLAMDIQYTSYNIDKFVQNTHSRHYIAHPQE